MTGEQLIRRQAAREYMNRRGEKVSAMEHRAGWDATFSAPKSVSLTALVGGDERVREAHRESVGVALDELEQYVQARIGGSLPREKTAEKRSAQIQEYLAEENQRGAGAAQIAAHQTREGKLEISHEEMQERHKAMARQFGNQPELVVEVAQKQRGQIKEEPGEKVTGQALTYSREKNLHREAVVTKRHRLPHALTRPICTSPLA